MPTIQPGTKDSTKAISNQDAKSKLSKSPSEIKDKTEEKVESVPDRRISAAGAERIGNIRNRFEAGEVAGKKHKKKGAPKIKYAGAESAKNKFMETANKPSNGTANGPRGPKEFTPPPEGVSVGVLESKPQPRAPDVVTADDNVDPIDLSVIGDTTKNLRAKFKHLEETGGQDGDADKQKSSAFIEEYNTVAPEASRTARARWKDIESGKSDPTEPGERPKIDIRGDGYGGVFENEPEQLENIVRGGSDTKDLPAGISAKERREQFLRRASEATQKKDTSRVIDINAAEGGIYENEPARREDVIRYDDEQSDDYPANSVKWASEAKNRFMQEATKTQERVQRTQPISVVDGTSDETAEKDCNFATQAKQAFMERQKQEEEAARNKARPQIIDIWGEKCADSGVFENKPAARSADVIASNRSDDEDDEESEEESDEE